MRNMECPECKSTLIPFAGGMVFCPKCKKFFLAGRLLESERAGEKSWSPVSHSRKEDSPKIGVSFKPKTEILIFE